MNVSKFLLAFIACVLMVAVDGALAQQCKSGEQRTVCDGKPLTSGQCKGKTTSESCKDGKWQKSARPKPVAKPKTEAKPKAEAKKSSGAPAMCKEGQMRKYCVGEMSSSGCSAYDCSTCRKGAWQKSSC